MRIKSGNRVCKKLRGMYPALLLIAGLFPSASAYAADSAPVIRVEDSALQQADSVIISPTDQDYIPSDVAEVLKSVPGANVNKNGPLTGIAQYRGMFGSRMNVQLDGLNVAPAGPNWMDPPLSHIAPSQMQDIRVIRGISPVSAGGESIGGTVQARTAHIPYASSDTMAAQGSLITGYDSNNQAYSAGGQAGMSSNSNRLQFNGHFDKGKDMQAGNGLDIVPTQYQRRNLGVEYGHHLSDSEVSLSYTNERVDNAGSPALPMDIIYVKGNIFSAAYRSDDSAQGIHWLGDIHYMDTDHKMDNNTLRTAPNMLGAPGTPAMQRFTLSNARDFAYKVHAAIPLAKGNFTLGSDGWMARHQADVYDPRTTAFKLQNYNQVNRNRFGLFGEWQSSLNSSLDIQTGLRYSRVNMNAGTVSASGFSGGLATAINALANNFNAGGRNQSDNLLDITMQLTQRINDELKLKIGVARKQRAPAYQERYLWSPLESTAGLADKRTYVGNVNLRPETAYTIDAGLDWQSDAIYFTPRVFFKRVKNYIQGNPLSSGTAYNFRVMQGNMLKGGGFCTANPLNPFCVPLQFSNVDAEFSGADAG
ncbi:MAG: TonB-dependent receptor, partial [Mariprofundaceae bacterium]|nr:TonB-dependent receptor [Mariprofundaceae bacterium]